MINSFSLKFESELGLSPHLSEVRISKEHVRGSQEAATIHNSVPPSDVVRRRTG